MLDKMYSEDQVGSYRVLITELKFGLGPYITPLVIADDSRAMDFMSRGCCQTYLQMVWKGNMGVDTPAWKVSYQYHWLIVTSYQSVAMFA